MKNRKRVLSVLLALAVVFTMCITAAVAVDTGSGSAATITVETVKKAVKVGDTVTLNVSIAGNPGFAAFDFTVKYDAGKLELTKVEQGNIKGSFIGNENTGKVNFIAAADKKECTGDGVLFTLTFNVKADCADGAQVTLNTTTFKNAQGDKLTPTIVAGGINVTTGGSTTGGSTTGGSTTGGSTTGGSTTGGSTTGGSTTGGSTTGGSTTGGGTTGGGSTVDYKIIEGANGTWTQNSDGTLTVRVNGEFSKFTGVMVDGKVLTAGKDYTAKSGSTIVTLSKDYLATLSVGTHKLTVLFNDGNGETTFTVKAASDNNPGTAVTPDNTTNNPQTGDHSGIVLAVVVLLVSGGALTVLGIAKKKAGKC